MDLAASIQKVTDEVVLRLARHARERTGMSDLVMAGGVALNCVANGHLLRAGIFDRIWIQPAAGDAGGALGAALLGAHAQLKVPRRVGRRDAQKGSRLGPAYSSAEVRAFLDRFDHPYEVLAGEERARRVAQALADGKVVGVLQGRMEFGPRALGARSILGDPRRPEMQALMNRKIKFRESFRPFAPSVLAERAGDWFELSAESPYMLIVAPVREDHRRPFQLPSFDVSGDDDLLPVVSAPRSDVPAVTHVDYSARIQTVHADDHPDYAALLRAFESLTGCPLLVNTSFNVRGEPIVCSPQDAYRCFMRTEMDMLLLEDCWLDKSRQPPLAGDGDWRREHVLD
jgi:carbamoyltransferase